VVGNGIRDQENGPMVLCSGMYQPGEISLKTREAGLVIVGRELTLVDCRLRQLQRKEEEDCYRNIITL
jgi:hypothetical protein